MPGERARMITRISKVLLKTWRELGAFPISSTRLQSDSGIQTGGAGSDHPGDGCRPHEKNAGTELILLTPPDRGIYSGRAM